MTGSFEVATEAGSLRRSGGVHFPHRWNAEGVSAQCDFTGAHLLHLSVAACILNDLYREASELGVVLDGVRVTAAGGFTDAWRSTGVDFKVELDTSAAAEQVDRLLAIVDEVAEIPRAIRAGSPVRRLGDPASSAEGHRR